MKRLVATAALGIACEAAPAPPPPPEATAPALLWKRPATSSSETENLGGEHGGLAADSALPSGEPPPRAEPVPTPSASASASGTDSVAGTEPRHRRGLWIWEFGKNAPLAPRAAELAKLWGVHRVFIKGSNGNQGPRWAKNASPENIAAFAEKGIEVWLFGYFYAPDIADADGRTWGSIDEQVAMMLEVAKAPGVTGVIVDAEEEFKERAAAGKELCTKLRAGLRGKRLGYTTFGWLSPNKKFPYATFDRHCGDAFLPQVYYAFGWPGGVVGSLDRLEKDLAAMKLKAPVWPVQSNEKDPSVATMVDFFAKTSSDASIFYFFPEGSPQTQKLSRLRFR